MSTPFGLTVIWIQRKEETKRWERKRERSWIARATGSYDMQMSFPLYASILRSWHIPETSSEIEHVSVPLQHHSCSDISVYVFYKSFFINLCWIDITNPTQVLKLKSTPDSPHSHMREVHHHIVCELVTSSFSGYQVSGKFANNKCKFSWLHAPLSFAKYRRLATK